MNIFIKEEIKPELAKEIIDKLRVESLISQQKDFLVERISYGVEHVIDFYDWMMFFSVKTSGATFREEGKELRKKLNEEGFHSFEADVFVAEVTLAAILESGILLFELRQRVNERLGLA